MELGLWREGELALACAKGDHAEARRWLNEGADPFWTRHALSLFDDCVRGDYVECLKLLQHARKVAGPEASIKAEAHALRNAARHGAMRCCAQLLLTVDPHARDEMGMTALMWAASVGEPECVALLVTGSEADAADNRGDRAIHFACLRAVGPKELKCLRELWDRCDMRAKGSDGTGMLCQIARRSPVSSLEEVLSWGQAVWTDADVQEALVGAGSRDAARAALKDWQRARRERVELVHELGLACRGASLLGLKSDEERDTEEAAGRGKRGRL